MFHYPRTPYPPYGYAPPTPPSSTYPPENGYGDYLPRERLRRVPTRERLLSNLGSTGCWLKSYASETEGASPAQEFKVSLSETSCECQDARIECPTVNPIRLASDSESGNAFARSYQGWLRRTATRPASSVAAVANRIGLPSARPARTTTIPHFTKVFDSAAITMATTATWASPVLASSAMESVMASTSTKPERPATVRLEASSAEQF